MEETDVQNMELLQKRISEIGIIPVIKIKDAAGAVPLAQALARGGLPAAEITFRTACAEEAIRRITAELPDMLVGAGTVLTVEQASRAKDAGASFIVSPGLNPEVVSWCLEAGVPVLPGVCTPSDIEKALSLGLKTVKFFPAEASGGVAMLKAMSAPYGDVRFMPTGGINEKNLLAYLSFPKVVACGGSFMVSEKLVDSGDYDAVTALTDKAVSLMLGCRIAHIGVNSAGREEAAAAADFLCRAFGFGRTEGPVSVFASDLEIMHGAGRGKNGHIAVGVNSVERAMFSLGRRGVRFDASTLRLGKDGKPDFVYLEDELLGFAIHLVRND